MNIWFIRGRVRWLCYFSTSFDTSQLGYFFAVSSFLTETVSDNDTIYIRVVTVWEDRIFCVKNEN